MTHTVSAEKLLKRKAAGNIEQFIVEKYLRIDESATVRAMQILERAWLTGNRPHVCPESVKLCVKRPDDGLVIGDDDVLFIVF